MVFATKEEREKAKQKLAKKGNGLMVEEVKNKDPLVTLKDVLSANTDEDILKALKNQNRPIFEDIAEGDDRVAVKYRRKGRNQHIGHVVLSVSPKIWKRVTDRGCNKAIVGCRCVTTRPKMCEGRCGRAGSRQGLRM
ncbi:unnamed protein product [Arctia plantaginis]|uniref:Uncharacterized protein n=1 Tax=Arctia plantaginis TaxID=874455 RepID=A0A8S1BR23_ARCPL|nr:unnamed protein product [Arctia plantaginis]